MEEREAEDAVNDLGRAAVGERKEEAVSHCISMWNLASGFSDPDDVGSGLIGSGIQ